MSKTKLEQKQEKLLSTNDSTTDFTNNNLETYIPNGIAESRLDINKQIGEIVWPKDRAGEIVRLSKELEQLRQDQLTTMGNFETEQIPNQLPMHDKIAEKYNKIQIKQLEAMWELIDAQKKAKLNETKAGNLNAKKEISEFNRNRLVEYSKAGAKSIGNITKHLAIGAGASTLWITKFGIEIGKEAVTAIADIWYSLWGAHRKYKEKYTNQNNI